MVEFRHNRYSVQKKSISISTSGNQLALTYDHPYNNWPLDPEHSSFETTGNPSVATGNCFTGDTGHPSLDYNSLRLKGQPNSFKEFTFIDELAAINDFTFSVFVSPEGESGTFFHYEKQDQFTGIDEIKGIIFSYDGNGAYLCVFGDNNTDVILNISMQNHFQDGQWTPVTVEYDESNSKFSMWIGTEAESYELELERTLGKPGKIRIGMSFLPGYSAFKGRVTCLQFYDSVLEDDFENALLSCMSTAWPTGLNDTHYLLPACEAMTGYYLIISKGMTPSQSTTPLASLRTSSKVRCADWCAQSSNECVSFAINRSNKVCKMYNSYESKTLVLEDGTDYYVSKIHLNCC